MKKYALSSYICPFSGKPLCLICIEERRLDLGSSEAALLERRGVNVAEASVAVKEGILYSEIGGYWFPIINFTPIFLDFPLPLHEDFRNRYAAQYDVLRRLRAPDGVPRPGEVFTQRSFTREWALIDLDLSFGLTPEQRDFFISLELDWPPGILQRDCLQVLEVGCGSGFESASLFRVTQAVIFGFDLNLALLQKGHLLADNPFINNAICSAYRLPLKHRSFDIVYSSGTLHHTHSTLAGLEGIVKFKKDDGLIYIWIYACEDSDYSLRARIKWLVEDLVRPYIARMSEFWQNAVVTLLAWQHYRHYKKFGGYSNEKWRMRDSKHFIRDLWTPLYAHRHSFNAMLRHFSEIGLEYRLIDPKKYYDFMKVPLIGIGIRGVTRQYTPERAEVKAACTGS